MTTAPGPAFAFSRRALPFVLGTVMVGVAVAADDRAVLFPEGTALAFGCWTAARPDWCGLGPRLILAPLLCAAAGITAVTVLPARLPAELAALTAATLITGNLRAPVAPAISAAVLPALAGVHSLTYALSVAVMAAVVWSGVLLRDRLRGTRPAAASAHGLTQARPTRARPAPARLALTWGITAGWLTVAAVLGLPLAASAPPLLASSYEWITGRITGGKPRRARDGLRLGGALTAAWTAGAIAAWRIGSSGVLSPARGEFVAGAASLTGRTVLAGLVALAAAAAVLAIVRVPHAPVPAIALVPLVLGPPHAWAGVVAGTCSVAVTVAVCYCSGSALLRAGPSRSARSSHADGRMSPGSDWAPPRHRQQSAESIMTSVPVPPVPATSGPVTPARSVPGYILTLSCRDVPGIVFAVSKFLVDHGCTITQSQQFDDQESGTFFMRVQFSPVVAPVVAPLAGTALATGSLRDDFAAVADQFGMTWRLVDAADRPRVLIMVSTFGHCLNDLLYRWSIGALNVDVAAIVSNHPDLGHLADSYGVPFHHVPVTADTKPAAERELLSIAESRGADLVVLARYMQILSEDLCKELEGRAINIHHSMLPSFKGARPYHQAHARGVKLVGATAHYVTPDLDEGPIIEQEVARVDHSLSAEEVTALGRDVECQALARAVRWHAENRILLNGGKTVVFH